jgi:hypothetical protein
MRGFSCASASNTARSTQRATTHVHALEGPRQAVFELNCPGGPINLRVNYGFSWPQVNRIARTAISCSTVVCGMEGDSWRFLKGNLRRRMRVGRRRTQFASAAEFAEPAPGLVLLHGRINTEDDKARSTEIPHRLRSVPVRSLLQVSPETYRSFYLSTCFPLIHLRRPQVFPLARFPQPGNHPGIYRGARPNHGALAPEPITLPPASRRASPLKS